MRGRERGGVEKERIGISKEMEREYKEEKGVYLYKDLEGGKRGVYPCL